MPTSKSNKGGPSGPRRIPGQRIPEATGAASPLDGWKPIGQRPAYADLKIAEISLIYFAWNGDAFLTRAPEPCYRNTLGSWDVPDGLTLDGFKRWAAEALPPRMVCILLMRCSEGCLLDAGVYRVPRTGGP